MVEAKEIEIRIGSLPEWYDEAQHDPVLEFMLEHEWQEVYPNATVNVSYHHYGPHYVTAVDKDGDPLTSQELDLDGTIERLHEQVFGVPAPRYPHQ